MHARDPVGKQAARRGDHVVAPAVRIAIRLDRTLVCGAERSLDEEPGRLPIAPRSMMPPAGSGARRPIPSASRPAEETTHW